MKPPNPPPQVVTKKSRSLLPRAEIRRAYEAAMEREREEKRQAKAAKSNAAKREAIAAKAAEVAKKAEEEKTAKQAKASRYEAARKTMLPLAFAEHVLKGEWLLYKHHGHDFIDGDYATPAMKVDVASNALVGLGLAPIVLRKRL